MKNIPAHAALAVVALLVLGGQVPHVDPPRPRASAAVATRLVPFDSADALRAWLGAHAATHPPYPAGLDDLMSRVAPSPGSASNRPPPTSASHGSITHNQVAGVDEGDIVKAHGSHLVILRRGRLFSVSTSGGALRAVSMVDAWGRGRVPGSWYDEMLIDDDAVVVVGYSYGAQATEVGRFDITAQGELRWRDTIYVRSGDYYSSRNYASRLVGHRLLIYLPVPLYGAAPETSLAAVRRGTDAPWETVLDYRHLFRPVQAVESMAVAHTVMSCDLGGGGFDCQAVGVVGPLGRSFHVSNTAIYLWVPGSAAHEDGNGPRRDRPTPTAALYRFPFDGAAPGAVWVRGMPIDQFSFDEQGGALRVMVRAAGGGDGMWQAERGGGDLGFLRVPLTRFRAELRAMEASAYRGLPSLGVAWWALRDRFVGDHLIYGARGGWNADGTRSGQRQVWVYDAATNRSTRVEVGHSVERIEPLGRDALVVGHEAGGLTFSALSMRDAPTLAGRHTVSGARQGETRSHGFYYLPDGERGGTLGLPVVAGFDGAWQPSGAVVFLGVDGLRFRELGTLRSAPVDPNDRCVASCVDWYGNARPIFWRDRVFALLGYELVEGSLAGGRTQELRRVNFLSAQPPAAIARRGNAFDPLDGVP